MITYVHIETGFDTHDPSHAFSSGIKMAAKARFDGAVLTYPFNLLAYAFHNALTDEARDSNATNIFLVNASTLVVDSDRSRIASMLADFPARLFGIGVLVNKGETNDGTTNWLRQLADQHSNLFVCVGNAADIQYSVIKETIEAGIEAHRHERNSASSQ